MARASKKTIRIEVQIPKAGALQTVLNTLRAVRGVTLNLLRGRLSRNAAWFNLEVEGSRRSVTDVIRLGRRVGASVRPIREGAAGGP